MESWHKICDNDDQKVCHMQEVCQIIECLQTEPNLKEFQEWKGHFKNLLENTPEIMDKPTKEIINGQQDIKLKQLLQRKL